MPEATVELRTGDRLLLVPRDFPADPSDVIFEVEGPSLAGGYGPHAGLQVFDCKLRLESSAPWGAAG